jgi:hypothetical protein
MPNGNYKKKRMQESVELKVTYRPLWLLNLNSLKVPSDCHAVLWFQARDGKRGRRLARPQDGDVSTFAVLHDAMARVALFLISERCAALAHALHRASLQRPYAMKSIASRACAHVHGCVPPANNNATRCFFSAGWVVDRVG